MLEAPVRGEFFQKVELDQLSQWLIDAAQQTALEPGRSPDNCPLQLSNRRVRMGVLEIVYDLLQCVAHLGFI